MPPDPKGLGPAIAWRRVGATPTPPSRKTCLPFGVSHPGCGRTQEWKTQPDTGGRMRQQQQMLNRSVGRSVGTYVRRAGRRSHYFPCVVGDRVASLTLKIATNRQFFSCALLQRATGRRPGHLSPYSNTPPAAHLTLYSCTEFFAAFSHRPTLENQKVTSLKQPCPLPSSRHVRRIASTPST